VGSRSSVVFPIRGQRVVVGVPLSRLVMEQETVAAIRSFPGLVVRSVVVAAISEWSLALVVAPETVVVSPLSREQAEPAVVAVAISPPFLDPVAPQAQAESSP